MALDDYGLAEAVPNFPTPTKLCDGHQAVLETSKITAPERCPLSTIS
ncbi:hypothetical protein LMG3441_00748 [Achromobacter kerstersii]|uniref:Uncharacterized protein n=1 Tax=Achromobacter kerstersii TaxID=1353890 RepID=A0A6S6Z7P7_9BURK|nr:hypothetical protein LMG3441_00748 [Achromobacter kerstersii]